MFRIGLGHDTHRLGPGDGLVIGGITIPHDRAAIGHSDADVLLHAITDAILGAAALGDIGEMFPDTDPANKGRDYLRRQRRRSAISLDAPVQAGGDAGLVDLLAGGDRSPSASLEDGDERAIVKHVVDELPPHFREILLLSYFQKLSYAQIADSLGIPLGTVKSRLHAAVAHFAQSWKLACARRGISTPPPAPKSPSRTESDE